MTTKSGSNNIHTYLPPLMSDARHFTNFDPSCEENNILKKHLNISSNYEYRQYLINNGSTVLKQNRRSALRVNNNQQVGDGELNHHNKYIFNSANDVHKPFGYQNSDLKSLYLSRTQLQERKDGPFVKMN